MTSDATKRQAARDLGAGRVLDRIALGEGPDRPVSYDTTYGYGAYLPPGAKALSGMTLDEVGALQAEMLRRQAGRTKIRSSAVGKYQFLDDEVVRLRDKLGLTGSDVFTPEVQDRFAREILQEQGYGDFLAGKLDARTFQERLARKWASVPRMNGRSRYGQRVGVSVEQMQADLALAKAEADPLIASFSADPYQRGWR